METLGKFLTDHHWGDIASVFGVIISVVGFVITIWGVLRSKTAAKLAQEAAVNTRMAVLRLDVLTEISSAIAIMEEIKRLHRITESWHLLPDRYTSVNHRLRAIRGSTPSLRQEHLDALQSAIQQFRDMEKQIEAALAKQGAHTVGKIKPAMLNEVVSQQIDKLSEILSVVRRGMEMERYDKG